MPRKAFPLTDVRIRQAKPADFPLYDSGGLHLIRSAAGARLWRLKYRRPDGRENRIALGEYPAVTLNRAREERDKARAMLRDGRDPSAERVARREAAVRELQSTFQAAARGWLKFKASGWAPETARKAAFIVDSYLVPAIGDKNIATLASKDVSKPLQAIAAKTPDIAHKARQFVGGIVRYAQREGLRDEARALPLDEILTKYDKGHIAAATTPDDIAKVLRAVDAYDSPVTRAALLMCAWTALRPGVVVAMRWDEIQGDEWHIPGAKMKMGHAHIVSLPKQAMALLETLRPYSGTGYVFPPQARQKTKHLNRDSLSKALRDMGFQGEHAPHGFRGALRTIGRERLNIDVDVLEAQLAHAKKGAVQKAYDRTVFNDARRKAMQAWADYLDTLRAGDPGSGKVVAIKRARS
jgi:integrase